MAQTDKVTSLQRSIVIEAKSEAHAREIFSADHRGRQDKIISIHMEGFGMTYKRFRIIYQMG